jgi:hypothetical protein
MGAFAIVCGIFPSIITGFLGKPAEHLATALSNGIHSAQTIDVAAIVQAIFK